MVISANYWSSSLAVPKFGAPDCLKSNFNPLKFVTVTQITTNTKYSAKPCCFFKLKCRLKCHSSSSNFKTMTRFLSLSKVLFLDIITPLLFANFCFKKRPVC